MENYITTSNEIYIFKPTLLLKLWDNCYDVMDIRTFGDINKIFLIKLYLLQDNYVGAYKEVKFLIDDIGNFSPSISYHAFIYYLGKIIAGIIAQINDNYKLTFYNAYLTHCKLFLDENNKYPILRYNKEEYDENQIVKGNIIESTNFEETLKNFDEWEDYPKLYDRIVVEAINIDKNNEKEEVILYIRDLDMIYLNDLPYDDYLEYLKCKKYLK